MAGNSKNPVQFWHELKQRKVVRVLTVYIASSCAILQSVDMIFPRLGLPSWSVTLVMILLASGLVIAVILSWIYDITPEGLRKTNDLNQQAKEGIKDRETELPAGVKIADKVNDNELALENQRYVSKINQYRKKEKVYSLSSLFVILAVVFIFLFSSGSTLPFSKRDRIIITDFENLTENPVFDKSLYTAFSLTINQSRYINVFPRSRMVETLARMKVEDLTFIDERSGREIAMREGINIYVVPSISEIGNKYAITAKILETKTGNLLKSIIINAETRDQILARLDQLSKRLRRDLGESRYKIATQDKPLSKVTTSSLEALKQYSLGIEHHYKLDFAAAKSYYENALNIDSGFTAAKASLGNLMIERFDPVKGRQLLSEAVKYVDNLTNKEKYGIIAFYAVNVENNIEKGIENTKILTDLYPDDPAYHNNLGWYYQMSGNFEEALNEYKTAVTINPNQALTYGGILWVYLEKLGKADSAFVWAQKMISDNPQNAWGYFYLASAYIGLDSISKAAAAYQKAREINPYFITNQYRLAQLYHTQGQYKEAIRILEKILEINQKGGTGNSEAIHERNQNEPSAYYDLGVNYQSIGNKEEARKYYSIYKKIVREERLIKLPENANSYITMGRVMVRMEDVDSSLLMLKKAIEIDSTLHVPVAGILCLQGDVAGALSQIEKALEDGYRDITWLKINPDLQILQNDSRFRSLLEKYFK